MHLFLGATLDSYGPDDYLCGIIHPGFKLKKQMNVLSLFDGCSCGQLALNRAGINVDNYYASEIDKHAIAVTMHNFPNTIQLGDIREVKASALPKIDLLLGGSPCQGFSNSGKMLNFDDPRSALFFEYVRILKELREINPEIKFLLENVKMKKEWVAVISEILGVEPVEINSALVSAQNRKRLYWANFPISQPADRGILLKDILNISADSSLYLSRIEIDRAIISHSAKTWRTGKRMGAVKFPTFTHGKSKVVAVTQVRGNRAVNHVSDNIGIRTLSLQEQERLQTMPDGYTSVAPKTARTKMIGNGWTIDVIVDILKNAL